MNGTSQETAVVCLALLDKHTSRSAELAAAAMRPADWAALRQQGVRVELAEVAEPTGRGRRRQATPAGLSATMRAVLEYLAIPAGERHGAMKRIARRHGVAQSGVSFALRRELARRRMHGRAAA